MTREAQNLLRIFLMNYAGSNEHKGIKMQEYNSKENLCSTTLTTENSRTHNVFYDNEISSLSAIATACGCTACIEYDRVKHELVMAYC